MHGSHWCKFILSSLNLPPVPHMFRSLKIWKENLLVLPWKRSPRELLRCLGHREWCATSANWKVPRWKSRVVTLSRIHQSLVVHFSSSSYRCQLDPPGSRRSLRKPTRLSFLLVSARSPPPPPSLSPSQNTYLSLYFSFLHLFSFIKVCPFAKVTKPFCNPLWWMHECVYGINFIFEIEVLCSIACWLRSEPPLKVCINCISWLMTRCSEQHWGTFQRKLFATLPQPQEFDNWKCGWASKLPLHKLSF